MGIAQALRRLTAGRSDTRASDAGDRRKLALDALGIRRADLHVETLSFPANGRIPARFTHADGEDLSPLLRWSRVPEGTREIVVLCEDPDAEGDDPFVHWVVYGIAPDRASLAEGIRQGVVLGENTSHECAWRGPSPPPGHGVHHYHFQVFALDTPLRLPPGANRDMLVGAMRGHVLAAGEVVGTYAR